MTEGALVCGFSDPAAEIAGLAWSLDGAEGGLLLAAGEVQAAAARIVPGDGATELSLEAPIATCEAKLEPKAELAPLPAEDGPGGVEATQATVSFELSKGGASGSKRADGHVTRFTGNPLDGTSVLRHLALPARDGSLLLVIALRPVGAEQDGELAGAWVLGANGAGSFGETLLSTEYDGAGRPTRAGLELWPDDSDAPPSRGAATRLGGVEEDHIAATLAGSSVDGTHGIGSYLLWRA